MTVVHVWHVWPSRQWPSSAAEESAFITDLRIAAAAAPTTPQPPATWERPDVTAVLNALRGGLTCAELLAAIPGAQAANLVAAYDALERRLQDTRAAWLEIVAKSTWTAIEELAATAAVLMPVPTHRILTVAANTRRVSLTTATRQVSDVVRAHVHAGDSIEQRLLAHQPPDERAIALGAQLHNPQMPALWGSPYFLPSRVAQLSPPRVADLLGERGIRDETSPQE